MRRSIIIAGLTFLLVAPAASAQRAAPVGARSLRAAAATTARSPAVTASVGASGRGRHLLKYAVGGAFIGAGVGGAVSVYSSWKGSTCTSLGPCNHRNTTARDIGLGAAFGAFVGMMTELSARH